MICLILLGALVLLIVHRKKFDPRVLRLAVTSIILAIGSELAFTLYISMYGLANLIGHYFKVISFYLIYKAIVETGFQGFVAQEFVPAALDPLGSLRRCISICDV